MRFDRLIETEHDLKDSRLVGEQLRDVAHVDGEWLALLSRSPAANHGEPWRLRELLADFQRRARRFPGRLRPRFLSHGGLRCRLDEEGAYTIHVTGAAARPGEALVEIDEVP